MIAWAACTKPTPLHGTQAAKAQLHANGAALQLQLHCQPSPPLSIPSQGTCGLLLSPLPMMRAMAECAAVNPKPHTTASAVGFEPEIQQQGPQQAGRSTRDPRMKHHVPCEALGICMPRPPAAAASMASGAVSSSSKKRGHSSAAACGNAPMRTGPSSDPKPAVPAEVCLAGDAAGVLQASIASVSVILEQLDAYRLLPSTAGCDHNADGWVEVLRHGQALITALDQLLQSQRAGSGPMATALPAAASSDRGVQQHEAEACVMRVVAASAPPVATITLGIGQQGTVAATSPLTHTASPAATDSPRTSGASGASHSCTRSDDEEEEEEGGEEVEEAEGEEVPSCDGRRSAADCHDQSQPRLTPVRMLEAVVQPVAERTKTSPRAAVLRAREHMKQTGQARSACSLRRSRAATKAPPTPPELQTPLAAVVLPAPAGPEPVAQRPRRKPARGPRVRYTLLPPLADGELADARHVGLLLHLRHTISPGGGPGVGAAALAPALAAAVRQLGGAGGDAALCASAHHGHAPPLKRPRLSDPVHAPCAAVVTAMVHAQGGCGDDAGLSTAPSHMASGSTEVLRGLRPDGATDTSGGVESASCTAEAMEGRSDTDDAAIWQRAAAVAAAVLADRQHEDAQEEGVDGEQVGQEGREEEDEEAVVEGLGDEEECQMTAGGDKDERDEQGKQAEGSRQEQAATSMKGDDKGTDGLMAAANRSGRAEDVGGEKPGASKSPGVAASMAGVEERPDARHGDAGDGGVAMGEKPAPGLGACGPDPDGPASGAPAPPMALTQDRAGLPAAAQAVAGGGAGALCGALRLGGTSNGQHMGTAAAQVPASAGDDVTQAGSGCEGHAVPSTQGVTKGSRARGSSANKTPAAAEATPEAVARDGASGGDYEHLGGPDVGMQDSGAAGAAQAHAVPVVDLTRMDSDEERMQVFYISSDDEA